VHPDLRFEQADASRLTFRDEFDVVFSNAALHWIIDHGPVLRGIAAALKPGGKGPAADGWGAHHQAAVVI
jgi:trans-aconitate 2-methyltransferase